MTMEIRKLVKAGAASRTISLPKAWLERTGLDKGDSVYVIEQDEDLIVRPTQKKAVEQQKSIEINATQNIDAIQRELTSAFINNYKTIMFTGKTTNQEQIKQLLQNYLALQIVEETPERITAKDLLNLSEISVEKTMRRMDMIIRAAMSEGHKTEEMNKLYFLLYRLFKNCLTDQNVAEQLTVPKENILSLWYVNINLGRIYQDVCELNEITKATRKEKPKRIYAEIEENYLTVMKAYFTENKQLAHTVLSKWKQFSEATKELEPELARIAYSVQTNINNIARIVIDR